MTRQPTKRPAKPKSGNQLVLTLDNSRAFRASDLSDLFGALASDYKRLSQHDLVISEISTGSLITVLKDAFDQAVELVSAANTLIKFGQSISDLIEWARRSPEQATLLEGQEFPVVATVETLMKAASRAGAEVNLRYEGPKGDKLLVHVKPIERRP
jgi:hypothetical protein